ncbi:MAG: hypothetical protein Q8O89_01785 [Nanoarchaeota archaeon]|nr:hypothetical protein [Nanoarchaeota archaeon]
MVEITNELGHLPATQAYLDFGLEQLQSINKRFDSWIAQQSFVNEGGSQFGYIAVKGTSEGTNHKHEECQDRIEWDLRFLDGVTNKALSDALLHEKRYPNITTFNSKPQIFDTADYIQIGVTNGERGWVKNGEFPANVRADFDYDVHKEDIHKPLPIIGIQTDVKREALAGFEAAYQWQCFRAMAVASSSFVEGQIDKEIKDKIGPQGLAFSDYLRSRTHNVYTLLVQLLPDNRLEEREPAALKSHYSPGTLEGALALELDHLIHHNFGERALHKERPIYIANGSPIEVITTENGYDALIKLNISAYGYSKDEDAKSAIEQQLKKYFNVELKENSDIDFVLELKDAHLIEKAIKEGQTNTKIHKFARGLGDALRFVYEVSDKWYGEKAKDLETEYKRMVDEKKAAHFSGLKEMFSGLDL